MKLVLQRHGSCHQQAPPGGSRRVATATASYVGEGHRASPTASRVSSPPLPSYQPTTHSDFGQERSPRALGKGHGEYSWMTQSLQGPLVQEPDPCSPAQLPTNQPGKGRAKVYFPCILLLKTDPVIPCRANVDRRVCPSHPIASLAPSLSFLLSHVRVIGLLG